MVQRATWDPGCLDTLVGTDRLPGVLRESHAPINAHHIGLGIANGGEQVIRPGAEVDRRSQSAKGLKMRAVYGCT